MNNQITILFKSDDNSTITLNNGRNFVVRPDCVPTLKKWRIDVPVKVITTDSQVPYSYEIINLSNSEVIFAGISNN